jgi:pullulanase
MPFDLLKRRKTHFVFWRPSGAIAPVLVLGTLIPGNPPAFSQQISRPLLPAAELGLWELHCSSLGLPDGIYHYWFTIDDTSPAKAGTLLVTDPIAYTVDYRLLLAPGYQPATVVKLDNGNLVPCDPDGESADLGTPPTIASLPPNNHLVIYELPTSWSRAGIVGSDPQERDVGTFRDVLALLDQSSPGANFSDLPEVSAEEILVQLGINALELLPPADTKSSREWGYATAHYFAPDYDLGFPEGHQSPTAASDLAAVIRRCHAIGVRFFTDVVMAFGHDPYIQISYPEFHLRPKEEPDNDDSYQSSRPKEFRDGFGGESWRYLKSINVYDPNAGAVRPVCPASQFQLAHLERWMSDFHLDGIRIDSVNNIANWDFVRTFSKEARAHFASRYSSAPSADRDARFLVVGEELSVPLGLITENCVDALWNEHFQSRIRATVIGESIGNENFEWTVRKMIDCRLLGFRDGAEAIIYITSHDTEGYRKERLYDFLEACQIYEKEQRAKLAFVCLFTAVGIPMIFAGEELCDQQDRKAVSPTKQLDPVNYARKRDPWRSRVFHYVANLVQFRKRSTALGVNDTEFIHMDFEEGRKIVAWMRGKPSVHDLVVVVANFSGCYTPGPDYIVHNWPVTPSGKRWREITQVREVPESWVGREPLYPWEAKVYEMY